jgi:hypothetical protein
MTVAAMKSRRECVHSVPLRPGEKYVDMISRWAKSAPDGALLLMCFDPPGTPPKTVYL